MGWNNVFHLNDILSVLTGLKVSTTHGDDVAQLITYMLGSERKSNLEKNENILNKYNIQTPCIEICKSYLEKQFPALAKIKINPVQFYGELKTNHQKFNEWMNNLEKQFGSMLAVKTIDEFNAEYKNKPSYSFSLFQGSSPLTIQEQIFKFIEMLSSYVTDPKRYESYLETGLSRGPAVALGQLAISELKKGDLDKPMEIAAQMPLFDAKQAAIPLSDLANEMIPFDCGKAQNLLNMAVNSYPKAREIEMVRWIEKRIAEKQNAMMQQSDAWKLVDDFKPKLQSSTSDITNRDLRFKSHTDIIKELTIVGYYDHKLRVLIYFKNIDNLYSFLKNQLAYDKMDCLEKLTKRCDYYRWDESSSLFYADPTNQKEFNDIMQAIHQFQPFSTKQIKHMSKLINKHSRLEDNLGGEIATIHSAASLYPDLHEHYKADDFVYPPLLEFFPEGTERVKQHYSDISQRLSQKVLMTSDVDASPSSQRLFVRQINTSDVTGHVVETRQKTPQ